MQHRKFNFLAPMQLAAVLLPWFSAHRRISSLAHYLDMSQLTGKSLVGAIFSIVSLLSSNIGFAYAGMDPNSPIQITSDSASYEQLQGQAFYKGNVLLQQGAHELKAEKLSIKKDRKGSLTVITAVGNPARYTGKLNSDPAPVYATATTIYYYPDKQLLVLEGAATLVHQQDKFQGPSLSYQLDKQIISARSQMQERPTIIIYPQVSKK